MGRKHWLRVDANGAHTEDAFRAKLLIDARNDETVDAQQQEHIVLLLDQFPAVLGGGERVVLRMARLLRDAGYRVSLLTFQVLCPLPLLETAGCAVYVLPIENVFSMTAVKAAWQMGRFLRRQRVSIVMTFFESSNLFGGLVTKAFSRARLIWNRRDLGILRQKKHRAAYRLLPWLPDYVIAVSEEVRHHAITVDRIPQDRVGVVYNGLNFGKQRMVHCWPDVPLIVTVGNIRPVKGYDTLVEAAALIGQTHPRVRFEIAGEVLDQAFFAELKQRVATLHLERSVRFLGGVADPGSLLQSASIFALPSRSEGFSNALLEAMMAGLPVVATGVGGNAEAVVDGVTGVIVPANQPEMFALALRQLLDDPERMRSMGEAGRQRAEQHFTEQEMLRRLQHIFRCDVRRTGVYIEHRPD